MCSCTVASQDKVEHTKENSLYKSRAQTIASSDERVKYTHIDCKETFMFRNRTDTAIKTSKANMLRLNRAH